jgi:hypothetical protein
LGFSQKQVKLAGLVVFLFLSLSFIRSLKSEYPVIALDCEMCETEDPVTKVRESTLIRLSVVNGFNPDEVSVLFLTI